MHGHAQDLSLAERIRSMARDQEIIHHAGLHRESIASVGSALRLDDPTEEVDEGGAALAEFTPVRNIRNRMQASPSAPK
jgi:hypothetical protein